MYTQGLGGFRVLFEGPYHFISCVRITLGKKRQGAIDNGAGAAQENIPVQSFF